VWSVACTCPAAGARGNSRKKPISCEHIIHLIQAVFGRLRGGWLRKTERGAALRSLFRLQDSIEELGGMRADWQRSFGIIGMAKFGGV
jgi:hypothetical protein